MFNSHLVESTLRVRARNYAWTRIENVDRANELLFGENPLPANLEEKPIDRVQRFTFEYHRDFDVIPHLASAAGAQFATCGVPGSPQPLFGSHLVGVGMFLRLRPYSGETR